MCNTHNTLEITIGVSPRGRTANEVVGEGPGIISTRHK